MVLTLIRSVLLYFCVVAAMRLMGKRQLGELEPSEFAVTMMISELATVAIQDISLPLIHGLIPILVIVSLEFIVTFLCLRSVTIRRLICGRPSILISNGIIDQAELRRTRFSLDELMSALRLQGAADLSQVRYAILEPGGQLSLILRAEASPVTPSDLSLEVEEKGIPLALVSDGRFVESNLRARGLDRAWVERWLRRHGKPAPEGIFLLTVDEQGSVYCAETAEKGGRQ